MKNTYSNKNGQKRILAFTGFFLPHVGGVENVTYALLQRLVKEGYEVDLFTCDTEHVGKYEVIDGIVIWRVPCVNLMRGTYPIPIPSVYTLKVLWGFIRKEHALIITFCRFFPSSLLGLAMSKLKRIPMIHSEFGSGHTVTSSGIVDVISKSFDHSFGSLIVGKATRLTGSCISTSEFLEHLGGKNIAVICPPSGIDFSVFHKIDTDLKYRLGLDKESRIITAVSRLIYAKGIHDLISAYKLIINKIPNALLLIVGEGPYRAELEQSSAKAENGGHIYFLGQKTPYELAEIFSITDVLVSPSYSEGLIAAPVIEAGAMGVPSVTTNVGGVKELLVDGVDVLLVQPGDVNTLASKVCEILCDAEISTKLSVNIKELVSEKFNWDLIIKQYLQEIKTIS